MYWIWKKKRNIASFLMKLWELAAPVAPAGSIWFFLASSCSMTWVVKPWPGFFQPKRVNQREIPLKWSFQGYLSSISSPCSWEHYWNIISIFKCGGFFPNKSKWAFMSGGQQQLLGKVQGKCNISVPGPKSDIKTQKVCAAGTILRLE